MPVPGPRTQFGPLPGYTNPNGELPERFNRGNRPPPVAIMGGSPGLGYVSRRGHILAPGTVRRLYRQAVNLVAAQAPYSWSANGTVGGDPGAGQAFEVTRALRYMTRSTYHGSGIDNTRFTGLHSQVRPNVYSLPVTVGRGQTRSRPTVRNRMSSFGSRVPTLNQSVTGAQQQ